MVELFLLLSPQIEICCQKQFCILIKCCVLFNNNGKAVPRMDNQFPCKSATGPMAVSIFQFSFGPAWKRCF